MGQGEIDQISRVIGSLEGVIATLTDGFKDLGEKFTGVVTAIHLHGERLDKVEETTQMLHQHHTGRTAVVRFLKALPYAAIGGGLGAVAPQWKAIIGLLH